MCTQVNQAADWWALGVLLLEMLTGESPFADKDGDELKTLSNISNGRLEMSDEHAAAEWGKMSIGLCTVKIATRLGYLKAGADVVEHPWLRGIDWDALANRTCQPPWRPKVRAAPTPPLIVLAHPVLLGARDAHQCPAQVKAADDRSFFDVEAAEEAAEADSKARETADIPPELLAKYQSVFDSFAA